MHAVLIGYGTTAHTHARVLSAEGVELASIVGRLPEQAAAFAQEFGITHWTTSLPEALLRPGLDLAIICSPSAIHAEQTQQCLAAGLHVLVEIPLAMSYQEAAALTAQAESTQRVLMVAHTHRFGLAAREVKKRIGGGAFHPRNIISRYVFLRREDVNWSGRRRSWRDNLLWHHGCHAVDLCLWLLGEQEPGQVRVLANIGGNDPHMHIPMDLSILLRTTASALASVNMSYNAHVSRYDYLVIGDETTLLISEGQLYGPEGPIPLDTGETAVPAVVQQDREFLAAVREGRPVASGGRSVLPAMWALQQAEEQQHGAMPTPAAPR
ncbi:MAG: Gfo/Idh/MocA family oxidoreductase [Chloroflexi bacterium]|nr:Gfo/Idh/MocA family oxidoreductase [Chloroflexota bacterium]